MADFYEVEGNMHVEGHLSAELDHFLMISLIVSTIIYKKVAIIKCNKYFIVKYT